MSHITIHLNAKLKPIHRHDLEDALDETFEKIGLKAESNGGGTSLEDNWEIASSDIEVNIKNCSFENIKTIINIMESMLAPIGSKIIIYPEDENKEIEEIPFGKQEWLGLYLSNDLDEEVYKNGDVNFVYQEIERLLENFKTGHIASYWEGSQTALYLYGKSFDEMINKIQPLLDEYPLCQKCKVVKIA